MQPANDNQHPHSRPEPVQSFWFALMAVFVALAIAPVRAAFGEAALTGKAETLDGDTLTIAGVPIRLVGIDAPELRQECEDGRGVAYACGAAAARALAGMVKGRTVECAFVGKDDYGRVLGVCRAGEINLNAEMVARGLALAFVKYDDRYASIEAQARAGKVGLWAGTFVKPWDWRSTILEEVQPASAGECVIKGNISRSGERIYHMPFHSFYSRTQIDEGAGERMFCSEDEAQAAGWRRALR
jgi:endonuclease YncB( thermonuclease family)